MLHLDFYITYLNTNKNIYNYMINIFKRNLSTFSVEFLLVQVNVTLEALLHEKLAAGDLVAGC